MDRLEDESNKVYNFRIDFIKKYSKNKDIKEKEAIKFSKIAANIKFRKCRYESLIYNKVKNYL